MSSNQYSSVDTTHSFHLCTSDPGSLNAATCHHLRQPWQCDSQKTGNTTPLKCCACDAKWRRSRPKCYTPRKLIFWKRRKSIVPVMQNDFRHVRNTSECHELPRLPQETRLRDMWNLQPPVAELTIGTAIATSRERLRTVTNGREQLRSVERTHPQPPGPRSETGTRATHSGMMRTFMNKTQK